jgi:hypothetical protein
MSDWRDEIESVNRRHLEQVLNKTCSVARSMGWPDEATRSTRDFLQNASKAQTQLLDSVMEGWKKQLTSSSSAQAVPPVFSGAMPEFNPMAPWTFWLQAAEAWQRTWMPGRSH